MMKVLGSLFRLLCSLLVLISAALYVQAPGNPDVDTFAGLISVGNVTDLFTSVNWVSISAAVLTVGAVLRLLPIVWNLAFCVSLILVTNYSLYLVFGPGIALPLPLQNNDAVLEFCNFPQTYQVPALLVALVFALGWLASNAAFRIAFCTLLCYGLWYLCAVLFHMCVGMWETKPLMDGGHEIIVFMQEHTWVSAAWPGVFFLVYTLLMSFFDAFPASAPKKKKTEEKAENTPAKADMKPAAAPTKKAGTSTLGKSGPTRPGSKPKPAALKKPAPTAHPAAAPAKPEAPAAPAKPEAPVNPEAAVTPAPKAEETTKEDEGTKHEEKTETKSEEKPETKPEEKTEATLETPAAPASDSNPGTTAAGKTEEAPAEKPADTPKAE